MCVGINLSNNSFILYPSVKKMYKMKDTCSWNLNIVRC